MRFIWLLVGSLVLTGCASRELLQFSGVVKRQDQAPLPAGYFLILREERHQDTMLSTFPAAVAKVTPDTEGYFSFSGFVCPKVFLFVPYSQTAGVGGTRDDPMWTVPLQITLNDAETATLLAGSVDEAVESSTRHELEWLSEAARKRGGLRDVPC